MWFQGEVLVTGQVDEVDEAQWDVYFKYASDGNVSSELFYKREKIRLVVLLQKR